MKRDKGAVLISLLIVSMVVVMFLGALLLRSQSNLHSAAHFRDSVKAEQAARAGVNHLLALFENDPDFSDEVEATLSGATYRVTFDPAQPNFSVNNLSAATPATQVSAQGYEVAARSAELVVTGTCGRARRTLRVVVQRGMSSLRSASAVGRIELSGDVRVDGVRSLVPPPGELEPEPAAGGLMSKHRSDDPSMPSIEWSGGTSFEMGNLSFLETAEPLSGGEAVSGNLRALFPEHIVDNSAADTIPEIDVAGKVTAGMSHPAVAAGGSVLNGFVYLDSPGSVNGDLTVNGDLVLKNGSALYVDGDLNLNGGIKGRGTIYVSGDIDLVGGNTLVQAGEPSGVALLVGGNASFQGIDATGYLNSLAAGDSNVQDALNLVNSHLGAYAGGSNGAYWGICKDLSKHPGGSPHASDRVYVSPIPSPDGRHVVGFESGYLPRLILAVKGTGLHLTDPRAAKVVSALEEMQYHFRDNAVGLTIDLTGREIDDQYQVVEGGVTLDRATVEGLIYGSPWDDHGLDPEYRTNIRLQYGPDQPGNWADYSEARKKAYLANNPLDFSFLGDSTFQGLVYVRGNVDASQGFQIIGGLATLGDVTLTGGCKLIMNEEYRDLLGPDVPMGIRHFEEI